MNDENLVNIIKIEDQFIEQHRLIAMQEERFIINTASSSPSSSNEDFFMDAQYLEPFLSSDSLRLINKLQNRVLRITSFSYITLDR